MTKCTRERIDHRVAMLTMLAIDTFLTRLSLMVCTSASLGDDRGRLPVPTVVAGSPRVFLRVTVVRLVLRAAVLRRRLVMRVALVPVGRRRQGRMVQGFYQVDQSQSPAEQGRADQQRLGNGGKGRPGL